MVYSDSMLSEASVLKNDGITNKHLTILNLAMWNNNSALTGRSAKAAHYLAHL